MVAARSSADQSLPCRAAGRRARSRWVVRVTDMTSFPDVMVVSSRRCLTPLRQEVDSHHMTSQGRRPALRSSPLTLMVLVLLAETPMHPYEMQRVMQARGKDNVVRVQRGSLYPAVERLAAAGLIETVETER